MTSTELLLNGHHFFWRINPGVGIVKRFNDVPLIGSAKVFASYKESSRTPSIAELACADPNAPCRLPNSFQADPPLDQVVNRNFEIGASGTKRWLSTYGNGSFYKLERECLCRKKL